MFENGISTTRFIVHKFRENGNLQPGACYFRGPDNLDVFADSSSSRSRANVNLERQQISLQKQIRALLMNVRNTRDGLLTLDDHKHNVAVGWVLSLKLKCAIQR